MDTMVTKERTILIVDDEGSMRHMLRMVLEKEGYQVLEASHGLQGLEVLSRATVDLVLCDIRMPEMDGIAFLRELERAFYTYATDDEALEAFQTLSRLEGILPALESAHAVAEAVKRAAKMPKDSVLIVNLSGRGDKDLDTVLQVLGMKSD